MYKKIFLLIHRLWDSATFTTWGSYGSQALNFIFVLPLLLTRLSTAEIAIWYLFKYIIDLQTVVDLGFSVTFSRYIAYLQGWINKKSDAIKIQDFLPEFDDGAEMLSRVYSTMRVSYAAISTLVTLLLASIVTFTLMRPISFVQNQSEAWASWWIIVFTIFIGMNGMKYNAFLQGINAIAEYRRWEVFTNTGAIICSLVVLLFHGTLLALVLAQMSWEIVNVVINRALVSKYQKRIFFHIPLQQWHFEKEIFASLWPSSWRSGLGQFMSYGVTQISAIVYAQFGTTANIASYLLGLRLIQQVVTFSRAPYYSKLPTLFRLYSEGKIKQMLQTAKRGMSLSYLTYLVLFLGLGLSAKPLLILIKSHVEFVPSLLWGLLGIAFLVERFGAHHIQLYSATNQILWHIANGVTGSIFIVSSVIMFPLVGVYCFPIGYILGYAGFYAWYSALNSYRTFKRRLLDFEPLSLWVSLGMILTYLLLTPII
jgi:O-antigen/teichoic acid export membrane protein